MTVTKARHGCIIQFLCICEDRLRLGIIQMNLASALGLHCLCPSF